MDQFIFDDISIPTREKMPSPFLDKDEISLLESDSPLTRGFNPFKWLKKIIKKLFKFLKKFWVVILVILLVVLAIYFPEFWAAVLWGIEQFGTWLAGLTWSQILGLGAAIATIISPEDVGKGLGHIVSGAGEGIGSIAGGIGDAIFGNPLGVAVVCGLLYFIFSRGSGNEQKESTGSTVINIEGQHLNDPESGDEPAWPEVY